MEIDSYCSCYSCCSLGFFFVDGVEIEQVEHGVWVGSAKATSSTSTTVLCGVEVEVMVIWCNYEDFAEGHPSQDVGQWVLPVVVEKLCGRMMMVLGVLCGVRRDMKVDCS